jgi:type II secretory pathway pseudopilin PulG
LIEVMIVIGIIAMVMMAGIPLLSRALNRDQLAKAVNDVLEGCKLARDRAVLRNQPYDFVIRSKSTDEWDMNVEPSRVKDGPLGAALTGGGGGGDGSGGVK